MAARRKKQNYLDISDDYGRPRSGEPHRADGDEHQRGGCGDESHRNKHSHDGRIDVGHHPSLAKRLLKIGASRGKQSMIRISGALDFCLDGRKRLGRVDIGQRRLARDWHFDNRLGVIADQVAGSYVTLNSHQVVEEAP
jgi:hypothetical protein